MKKILLFLILLIPINIYALSLPETYSDTVLIYDINEDKILFNKNGDANHSIASLTKMATIITSLDHIDDYKKQITITDQMRWAVNPELSIHKIQTGAVYTYDDLLHMCMLESAADACMAVAFDIAGSEAKMVDLVNNKMNELGLTSTHFVNITGLDDVNHYSSARDVLKLMQYSLKNEKFRSIFTSKEYKINEEEIIHPGLVMMGTMLNLDTSKILGDKTGFTDDAGLCLASLIQIEDHEMIMVTLGAPPVIKSGYHIQDAVTLIYFLEDNYNYEILYNKNDIVHSLDIELSKETKYDIKVTEDVKRFLPSDYDTSLISYKYDGKKLLSYLDKIGDKIGTISYYYDGELLNTQDVIIDSKINFSIPKIIDRNKNVLIPMVLLLIFLIISVIIFFKRKKKIKLK